MADLNTYLMAKLVKSNAYLKEERSESPVSHGGSENHSPKTIKRASSTSQILEEDYSTGSDFWKCAIEKLQETQVKPPIIKKSVQLATRKASVDKQNSPSIASLLRKIKDPGDIREVSSETLSMDEIQRKTELVQNIQERIANLQSMIEIRTKEITDMINNACGANEPQEYEPSQLEKKVEAARKEIDIKLNKLISQSTILDEKISSMANESNLIRSTLESEFEAFKQFVVVKSKETREEYEERIAHLTNGGSLSDLNAIKILLSETKDAISHLSAGKHHSSTTIDRPTKSLIVGVNDKLIHLAKLHEHSFETHNFRLSQIEKKLGLSKDSDASPDNHNIKTLGSQLMAKFNDFERQRKYDQDKLDCILGKLHHSKSEADDSDCGGSNNLQLQEQIRDLKTSFERENQITQDRMSQFMNMFSILQDAHIKLIKKLENPAANLQEESQAIVLKILDQQQLQVQHNERMDRQIEILLKENERTWDVANQIDANLIRYLPLNLESKLQKIEDLLK